MTFVKYFLAVMCLIVGASIGTQAYAKTEHVTKEKPQEEQEVQEHVGYYALPNLKNFIQTLIRNHAASIYDDSLIDVYARTTECKNFLEKYPNEFDWEKERARIRKTIKSEVQYYPVAFQYKTQLRLDRYNFKEKYYPFYSEDGIPFAANTFTYDMNKGSGCGQYREEGIALKYKFVIGETLRFVGLQLTEKQGRALFERMEEAKNLDHFVYPIFYLRVKYIAPLVSDETYNKESLVKRHVLKRAVRSAVVQERNGSKVVIDADLDFVEYYEDPEHTKLIYTYRP